MVDPSHNQIIDFIMWAIGGAGAAAVAFLGIWWKVESGQSRRIKEFHEYNMHQHDLIHGKIDNVRDKVEEIWKHMVRRNGGRPL